MHTQTNYQSLGRCQVLQVRWQVRLSAGDVCVGTDHSFNLGSSHLALNMTSGQQTGAYSGHIP